MKKLYLQIILFVLTVLSFSCSKNEDEIELNDFKGFYQISSITSNVKIDLNNDGLKTTDYLQEIKSNYISYNGEIINYGYNNELNYNFAEAQPSEYNVNKNTQFLDIKFPIQRIDSVFQGNDNFVKMNMEYSKIGSSFIYKLSNNNVKIESDPFNQFEYYNINNFVINRINKEKFEIFFDFKVYDFTENKWIETKLTAKYIKIGE
ncbi:hypothetical protein [Flavobacterium petrolei]|jgi:hypothetical protein|uniref:hypothetical protein n=1 Tax=Flavobacterium petrolei TaxID=2259594 RepID=UPI003757D2C4